MLKRKDKFRHAGRLLLVLLLAAGLLCGCGLEATPANSGQEPGGASASGSSASAGTGAASETGTGAGDSTEAEESENALRLAQAKDGFLWDEEGYLQAVDEEGNLRSACYVGVLHFRLDGRYSSGNKELDALVASVIRKNITPDMTRMEMLEAMYDYTVGNIRYAGLANYECSVEPAHGRNGWMPECAIRALRDGNGNCYCFAAAFAALARGLGFQAYAVGGVCGGTDDPHGWVQILDEDGKMWMNDPEIEFRFGDYQKQVQGKEPAPDLFYKSPDEIGTETHISYRAQCDPYAAEAKEAEERAERSAKLKAARDGAAGITEQLEEPAEVEAEETGVIPSVTEDAAAAAQAPAAPAGELQTGGTAESPSPAQISTN